MKAVFNAREQQLTDKPKAVSKDNEQEAPIPRWFVTLPSEFFKAVSRLARRRHTSEAEILWHALKLVREEKQDEGAIGSIMEDNVWLRSVSKRVPIAKAKQLYSELGALFGGMAKLTPEERSQRARLAAQARWQKERKSSKQRK